MSQFHFDPSREDDAHSLPDGEVWYDKGSGYGDVAPGWGGEPGWYYWACFPGCLPDGDPVGPFDSEAEAITDARENA